MKRNHINGKDGGNLYSVRQISSALRLREREAKSGMLNGSRLGCQFKHLLCILFFDQIDVHFMHSGKAVRAHLQHRPPPTDTPFDSRGLHV